MAESGAGPSRRNGVGVTTAKCSAAQAGLTHSMVSPDGGGFSSKPPRRLLSGFNLLKLAATSRLHEDRVHFVPRVSPWLALDNE